MNTILKIISLLFALLFLISAVLQYNDPDPVHWIFLYGLAAIVNINFVLGKLRWSLVYICIGAAFLQLMIVADGALQWYLKGTENFLTTPMSADKPYIEEIREFLGVGLVLVSCGIQWLVLTIRYKLRLVNTLVNLSKDA